MKRGWFWLTLGSVSPRTNDSCCSTWIPIQLQTQVSVYVHVLGGLEDFELWVCACVCVLPVRHPCGLQRGLVERTALGCQGAERTPRLLWPRHQLTPLLSAELRATPMTDDRRQRSHVNHHQRFLSIFHLIIGQSETDRTVWSPHHHNHHHPAEF